MLYISFEPNKHYVVDNVWPKAPVLSVAEAHVKQLTPVCVHSNTHNTHKQIHITHTHKYTSHRLNVSNVSSMSKFIQKNYRNLVAETRRRPLIWCFLRTCSRYKCKTIKDLKRCRGLKKCWVLLQQICEIGSAVYMSYKAVKERKQSGWTLPQCISWHNRQILIIHSNTFYKNTCT